MILNETVAAIAEAIREKTGKSELIKPVDFAEEIKGITSGGSGESPWKYYLLDWGNISQEAGYTRELGLEIAGGLDAFYYTAYVMPSKAIFTGTAVTIFDTENWSLGLYRAMRWKASETSFDAEIGNRSPKEYLSFLGADNIPFAATMAERMTECTEEEFCALTK